MKVGIKTEEKKQEGSDKIKEEGREGMRLLERGGNWED